MLSNHDVTRHVTRYGRADTSFSFADRQHLAPTDRELGTRRARAAALLTLALPGAVYIYQGEELGLSEVEDLPDEVRQDPVFARTAGADIGRDGCRVPLPWSGDAAPFGFNSTGAAPWLPQPAAWSACTVERQTGDPDSMLELYRRALRLRPGEPALGDGPMAWLDQPSGVLAFARGDGFACVVNLSTEPVPLPAHREVLLASGPVEPDPAAGHHGLAANLNPAPARPRESNAPDPRPTLAAPESNTRVPRTSGHQATRPASSKKPAEGPSEPARASSIAMAAPCSGVRNPRSPFRSVAT